MGSAKRRNEVVKRVLVRQIDNFQTGAPFIPVRMEQVIVSDGDIEEIALCDARRVVIVVLSAGGGYADEIRTILRLPRRRYWD